MAVHAEHLRFILGLKLKTLRHRRGASLKEVAGRAGLSISYLSEIEKGKKYPKPDKLIDLAGALEVPYDELVSLRVTDELAPLKALFSSEFIHVFPFELFGMEAEDLMPLVADEPTRASALVRTFLEIGRMYDVQVEHFLFAALRSYQQMHRNHFEDLEAAAAAFRAPTGWSDGVPEAAALRAILEERHAYRIDTTTLPGHPDLAGFRSVFRDGTPPTLYVHGDLLDSQRAFLYAREIGFRELGLDERPVTSSWIRAASFEQVLNNHRASYFAGAVLIDAARLAGDLRVFFERERWSGEAFLALMERYRATPEMFFYRVSEVAPAALGLSELYFLRFHNPAGTTRFRLTKLLNMSQVAVPHGMSLSEHYCRRWPSLRLLEAQPPSGGAETAVGAQRCRFVPDGSEFFVVAAARPLALREGVNSAVSLGFLMDDAFRAAVRFADDPSLPSAAVNLTCERCPLTPEECRDRVAPPVIYRDQEAQRRQERAVERLLAQAGDPEAD